MRRDDKSCAQPGAARPPAAKPRAPTLAATLAPTLAPPLAPTLARLAVALISVVNASAALTQPNAIAATSSRLTLAADASGGRGAPLKRPRPPRMPRRDPTNFELREVAASGSAADL